MHVKSATHGHWCKMFIFRIRHLHYSTDDMQQVIEAPQNLLIDFIPCTTARKGGGKRGGREIGEVGRRWRRRRRRRRRSEGKEEEGRRSKQMRKKGVRRWREDTSTLDLGEIGSTTKLIPHLN